MKLFNHSNLYIVMMWIFCAGNLGGIVEPEDVHKAAVERQSATVQLGAWTDRLSRYRFLWKYSSTDRGNHPRALDHWISTLTSDSCSKSTCPLCTWMHSERICPLFYSECTCCQDLCFRSVLRWYTNCWRYRHRSHYWGVRATEVSVDKAFIFHLSLAWINNYVRLVLTRTKI